MTQTVHVTYCGIDGEGRTLTEAKKAAAHRIEAMVREMAQPPVIVRIGGQACLVAYTPDGWGSRLITEENGALRDGPQWLSSGTGSRREAINRAAEYAAQAAWVLEITNDAEWLASNRPSLVSADDWQKVSREVLEWTGWQRRYRQACKDGFDDNAARHIADGLYHLVPGYRPAA